MRKPPWPALLLLLLAAGCTREPARKAAVFPLFVEVAAKSNISFQHDNGFDGTSYRIVETVNGGLALLDYDEDGWLDIYFTNGRSLNPGPGIRNALYKNNGNGSFTDVSSTARVGGQAMSMGASVADVDGDGLPDIYVTNWGPNYLYHNNGDGTFTDIAGPAGLTCPSMNSGSAFLDMDHDGDLDLYVASYVVDDGPEYPPFVVRGVPGYWPPKHYKAAPHHLFENEGNGHFIDVSESSGIRSVEPGRGLGVIAADFNGDGHSDVYVANDTTVNFMFLGDGKGHFHDVAFQNGTGLSDDGKELGSMGLDAQDYDGDAKLDLCVTNYQDQINNLYRAAPGEGYEEMARYAGILAGKLPEVSWGVGLVDLDNDGWRDLFVANGHLNPGAHEMDESTSYSQRKKIFRNLGNGRFENITDRCGDALKPPRVSRGAAFGDLDNDGDIDVVIVESRGSPELLRNEGGNEHSWCHLRLKGAALNRDAIGAKVSLTAGGRVQVAERRSSESYLSANDPRLHFGLGGAQKIDRLQVDWPDGKVNIYSNLPIRSLIQITEGQESFEVLPFPGGPPKK